MANINRVQTEAQPRFVLGLYLPYKLRVSLYYIHIYIAFRMVSISMSLIAVCSWANSSAFLSIGSVMEG